MSVKYLTDIKIYNFLSIKNNSISNQYNFVKNKKCIKNIYKI